MKRRRRSAAHSRTVGIVVTAALVAGVATAGTPATAQVRGGSATLMACLNTRTDTGNVFRRAPESCALHFANKPFDGNDIAPVGGIRWSDWGAAVARGIGTFHGNMNYTTASTIVVSRARRCPNGTSNYTWAAITTRGIGTASGPLAACRN
jgi:hypothetical protein